MNIHLLCGQIEKRPEWITGQDAIRFTVLVPGPRGPQYHRVVIWNPGFDEESMQLGAGTLVFVKGSVSKRTYTKNDGSKALSVETHINGKYPENFQVLGTLPGGMTDVPAKSDAPEGDLPF